MIILIDGDNRPKACLKGIENLQKKDIVYILYNETNVKAYTSKFKADVIEKSKAKVKFVKINTNSKNGVDFASSQFLSKLLCKDSDKRYILVSGDKHFHVIASTAKQIHSTNKIHVVETLDDIKYINKEKRSKKLNQIKKELILLLGDETADKICGDIRNQLNQCTQLTETN